MKIVEIDEIRLARQSARNFSYILAAASFINFYRWYLVGHSLAGVWIAPFCAGLIAVAVTTFWKGMNVFFSSFLFWMGFLWSCYATAVTNIELAPTDVQFTPFGGFKMAAIAIAILAPQPALNGYLSIALCGLLPVVMYATTLVNYQSNISVQEPGLTIVTAVISLMILFYRNRGIVLERSYAGLIAEKENLQELATIFLALRDLTNTPLQIISLTVNLMNQDAIDPKKAAQHLRQAVEKLGEISAALAEYQGTPAAGSQFRSIYNSDDPVGFLRSRLNSLMSKGK